MDMTIKHLETRVTLVLIYFLVYFLNIVNHFIQTSNIPVNGLK